MAEPLNRQPPMSQRLILPMLPAPRPVDANWTCCRSGDCCTKITEVVMTKEEASTLVHAAPKEITLEFRPVEHGMVALKAGPCPLYVFGGCLVYDKRPYNCRRFVCLRPDVKAEAFEPDGNNMYARTKTSRVALRMARKVQRKAMRWAVKHGWKDDNGEPS